MNIFTWSNNDNQSKTREDKIYAEQTHLHEERARNMVIEEDEEKRLVKLER
jgi:hypothetical protein